MRARKPQMVAVAGGSGAGKSWLARRLQDLLGEKDAAHLSLDDFYRDRSRVPPLRRRRLNYDHPRAIEWNQVERVLSGLADGGCAELPIYDFDTHTRLAGVRAVKPRPVIIVEGLWPLRRPSVRRLFQFRVYVDCPAWIRLQRRLRRDVAERGREEAATRREFFSTVLPMHDQFVAGQRRWANVLLQSPISEPSVEDLAGRIRSAAQLAL